MLEVRKRDVEMIRISVECALWPDLNFSVLDRPLQGAVLLVPILVDARIVWEFLLLGINTFTDIDGIYHSVQIAQKVIEEQESRSTLYIHLE